MARSWEELLGGERARARRRSSKLAFSGGSETLSRSHGRALTQQFEGFDPNDEEAWERVEEALIGADVGVPATAELVRRLESKAASRTFPPSSREIALLGEPGTLNVAARPAVVLVVGVNGTGKTTTIGKLAAGCASTGARGRRRRRHVPGGSRGAAGDLGGAREADFVGTARGGDPAAVAFDAIEAATAAAATS